MLSHLSHLQLVVPDRALAAQRWQLIFGAEQTGEDGSRHLNAHRTTVRAGRTTFEFLEPAGPGPVQAFREQWGQGLYGAGFATQDLAQLRTHIAGRAPVVEEKDHLYLDEAPWGMPTFLVGQPHPDTIERVGHIQCVYEVTNPVSDWRAATDYYSALFALDEARYCPIGSKLYGYEGTLTLFDPPRRLDRIEVVQTYEGGGAMDRFYRKRAEAVGAKGALYMCYIELDDVPALEARLQAANLRYAPGENRPDGTNIFIHPSALFGMLMGVSRTKYGWAWSGHPDLAGAPVGDGVH